MDIVHLILTTRALREGRELGHVVAAWLAGQRWTPVERPLVDRAGDGHGDAVDHRAVVLLAWLRHVEANIVKSSRYGKSRLWVARNIDPVLRALTGNG